MNYCETCKHYTPPEPTSLRGRGLHGDCKSHHFQDANDGQSEREDTLRYWDYESYSCGFSVGPKFGCIHHEPKP